MKILVTITETESVDTVFEIDGLEIDSRYLSTDLNEWDAYALEEAVQIAEDGGGEVVTATIGPEGVEGTVRQALAKGADRAIRVWDEELAALDILDPLTKATVLGAVVDAEQPDLVFTGVQSGDDVFGATPVALASTLGWAWGTVVNDLQIDEVAHVHRELEGNLEELTDVERPAVLSIQTGINQPRHASLRDITRAQQAEIDTRSLADLDLDVDAIASPIEQTDLYEPESEGEATIYEGSPEETATELAAVIEETGVIR
ncbi:electron transfer flavoprotein subunit beta/FixA family protein [Halapricum hydrolyticum]|uniref:Electron transfer flavoprotein subunit beta/FixA family protein n=1 Tax=Halapricum hydrolyticum TaxID=2979991 RepID=A0AAE3LEZ5_9EURY|nr:electron transfer flavoprotein subunit beta/FixA family protein [Halapricum hydrolyticum]MCU4717843.1 electron transfer flavoprotein subunit beta/FixA family protein [Halapricum hydrolyticum]MCU4727007.1 electron transfer flavoprotein subunit beta/FixA family protein [Halapricum hydrolyticum]